MGDDGQDGRCVRAPLPFRSHQLIPRNSGAICCIGGPALIHYVSPTEEELFLKYNPELQQRSLENRVGRQQDFDDFVVRLKDYSKSDKPSMLSQYGLKWRMGDWQMREQG